MHSCCTACPGANSISMMLQDIQQQLEELQQSVEDSSEMAAQLQQLQQQNLELDRSATSPAQSPANTVSCPKSQATSLVSHMLYVTFYRCTVDDATGSAGDLHGT